MRKQAIVNARVPGMRPLHVTCAKCPKVMREGAAEKEYRVDHIIPASEPAALIHNWDDFFQRLNVSSSGLQILCEECHDRKTAEENSARVNRKARAKAKRRKSPRLSK